MSRKQAKRAAFYARQRCLRNRSWRYRRSEDWRAADAVFFSTLWPAIHTLNARLDARGIDSGEAGETPQAARPEGQEPGPKDAHRSNHG